MRSDRPWRRRWVQQAEGRLAYYLREFVRDPLISFELMLIGVGYEKFCDERGTSKQTDAEKDAERGDDGFRIWRLTP